MQPWQLDMLDKLSGFKPGEMQIISSGRRAGKSTMTAQTIERLMQDLMNRPVEDLVLSEGRVYGARYHCVEPVGGNWLDMESWATETYGTAGSVWNNEPLTPERWYMNDRKFWFRNERDRTLFIMRWSK